ncbi:UBX domain-containing protein 4 [Megachile rotundata]|uniref:UBX domain-containing protein 4 n=1 Tax=Megachile rotundata TaxID=143995 RepID=UPI000258E81A|nr:PREDICTED: UBX domain-containing protein 4 [Megachile rotundata]
MKWFEGSINEAVATSKSRRAIFVVFVEGKDDTSTQVAEAINATEVSHRLEQEDFVAIRLESGSESYVFFVQIYQMVPVPSLFFIGENGMPLEIVAGNTTSADLLAKIDLVLSKAGKNKNTSTNLINAEQKAAATSNATNSGSVNIEGAKTTKSNTETSVPQTKSENVSNVIPNDTKEQPSTSLKATETPKTVNDKKEEQAKELSTEDKLERARKMIELQQRQRIEEEERKEKERELERRKMRRDMQGIKQKQQELTDREKIRQQIAQDKLERKQKELALQQMQPQPSQELPKSYIPTAHDATVTRIQFRLPSGNPHMGQFDPTCTLRNLRTYVVENISLPFRQFAMSTSFPRRELTSEDDDKTLLDLELVPTAVILILPLKNSNTTTTVTSTQDVSLMPRFVWSIFAVVTHMYSYLVSYFTGRNSQEQQSSSTDNKDSSNASGTVSSNVQNVATSSGLVRRYTSNREGTTIKTEGNIHRLHSGGDDNDENNTWNGNSTQQM